jgi:hypothetical protein
MTSFPLTPGQPPADETWRELEHELEQRAAFRTTFNRILAEYGGPGPFWWSWMKGRLDHELQDWLRRRAALDLQLRADLESIEKPAEGAYSTSQSLGEIDKALEALDYLVERRTLVEVGEPSPCAEGAEIEVNLALTEMDPDDEMSAPEDRTWDILPALSALWDWERKRDEPRRQAWEGLFGLLEAVEIYIPREAQGAEAAPMFRRLVGTQAVKRFRRLRKWVSEVRARSGVPFRVARDQVLRWVTPELFEQTRGEFRYRLSFGGFISYRLREYCEQRGWSSRGPNYRDLRTAFASLSPEQIGERIREAVQGLNQEPWEAERVRVSSEVVLELLRVAP